MIDRINEKNKDPEYLNQFNPKDGEKLTPEDLWFKIIFRIMICLYWYAEL